MRSRSKLAALFCVAMPCFSANFHYYVAGSQPTGWSIILSSIGLLSGSAADAGLLVVPAGTAPPSADWAQKVEKGAILVVEGNSGLAASFGFKPGIGQVLVRSVEDVHAPKLKIVWEKPLEIPKFELPQGATVFARERHEGTPLVAGLRRGTGAVLWVATAPGTQGYERFPYLAQALTDLGLDPPFRNSRLWAFFDGAYRLHVDFDYLAPKWRAAGIEALQVAAWHYWEKSPESDAFLQSLIEACHRNSIQVYAWVELPHVSERFWADHPQWREKTAAGQDAQLDWRKLMNLTNRDAYQAVSAGVRELVDRFDWDGVNLAELYFESLEGHENPSRLTPMNADVRAEFRGLHGFDPAALFDTQSPRYWTKDAAALKLFLDYRAELSRRQQAEWIGRIEEIRKTKSYLDLTLTHVDDRFDATMRDKIGADASKTLPLLNSHDFTFLVEDPATIWHLGPQRYPEIASRYAGINPRPEKLAIDVNIVERYQDVYPTKMQTGTELFSLVHTAVQAFPRVALYFEYSISAPDWNLLPSSAAIVDKAERIGNKLTVESRTGVGVRWEGDANVDGRPWPAGKGILWLPGGRHTVEPSTGRIPLRLLDLGGDLRSAAVMPSGMTFVYESSARTFARFERPVTRVEIDGVAGPASLKGDVLVLPRGQHMVVVQ